MSKKIEQLKKWDTQEHLRTERDIREYWEAALAESKANDDPRMRVMALGHIARARGMEELAKAIGENRQGVYDTVVSIWDPSSPLSTPGNMLFRASPDVRLEAAEFQCIVAKYQLIFDHEPHRLYPVGEMEWPPPGWMPLVERLIARLIKLGWNRHLAQVKSKFGGLRYYVGRASPAVRAAITRAELRSYRACDRCGQPGRQREEEGYSVRCEEHRDRTGKPMGIKLIASSRPSAASHLRRSKP